MVFAIAGHLTSRAVSHEAAVLLCQTGTVLTVVVLEQFTGILDVALIRVLAATLGPGARLSELRKVGPGHGALGAATHQRTLSCGR